MITKPWKVTSDAFETFTTVGDNAVEVAEALLNIARERDDESDLDGTVAHITLVVFYRTDDEENMPWEGCVSFSR